jgi:hypothetical protein
MVSTTSKTELQAKPAHGYVGWELPEHERTKLLAIFKPSYPDVIAHHVTFKFGVKQGYPLPTETHGEVIGVADDGDRVQALVVTVDGNIYNADNRIMHITWSLDKAKGARAHMSNQVIGDGNFTRLEHKIPIQLVPQFFVQQNQ